MLSKRSKPESDESDSDSEKEVIKKTTSSRRGKNVEFFELDMWASRKTAIKTQGKEEKKKLKQEQDDDESSSVSLLNENENSNKDD